MTDSFNIPEFNDTTPLSPVSRKDELLATIVSLTEVRDKQRKEFDEKKASISGILSTKEAVDKEYKEILERREKINSIYNQASYGLEALHKQGTANTTEIEKLQRELNRLLDTERIQQDYLNQVEAFRESCLTAPWRAENRLDGMGAKEHQIEGAIHLAVNGQSLFGDKRGLGKSLTSIIFCDLVEARKVIVIAPGDTLDNFAREVQLWTRNKEGVSHRNVVTMGGMEKGQRDFLLHHLKLLPQFLLLVNYEAWRKDPQLIDDMIALKAHALIEDEAHKAKNMETTTAKGIHKLRFGLNVCPNCDDPKVTVNKQDMGACFNCGHEAFITDFCSIKYVLPMTGTPILNRPQELFPHLRLIDPANYKSEKDFLYDYCQKDPETKHWRWRYGAEKQLMEKIGPRYLARDRKSAGVIIPPATPVLHKINMEELKEDYHEQWVAYEQARRFGQILLDKENKIAMSMPAYITVLLRLRQVLTWPAAIELKVPNEVTGEMELLAKLDVHQSAKLDKAEELIREIVSEGERIVLFSQFKGPLEELKRRLDVPVKGIRDYQVKAGIYNGDTSKWMKQELQLDFDPKTVSSHPKYDVILCNYKAAAEGLNFNAASQMIILDEEWNPGKQSQAYGRIDRMGQTKETLIHTIRVATSVDDWMAALIEEKADIIGGFESQANLTQALFQAIRDGDI